MTADVYMVVFRNPAMGLTVRTTFPTLAEAEARVEHYSRKYGNFAGYRPAEIAHNAADPVLPLHREVGTRAALRTLVLVHSGDYDHLTVEQIRGLAAADIAVTLPANLTIHWNGGSE